MKTKLEIYADILLNEALNLQTGQILYIRSDIEFRHVVNIISKKAYQMGASFVEVEYTDDALDAIRSENSKDAAYPEYLIDHKINRVSNKPALLFLNRADKSSLKAEIINNELLADQRYRKEKSKYSFQSVKTVLPTMNWAREVFPDSEENIALENLWDVIFDITFVKEDKPLQKWQNFKHNIEKRRNSLNGLEIDKLHIFDGRSDFTVSIADDNLWVGGFEVTEDDVAYMPNFPTEEIFTAPKKYGVNGTVFNSRPLVYGGETVNSFSLKFNNGYVEDYHSEDNQKLLDSIFSDEDMRYLGEVALLSGQTMISKSNLVFYTTLLDENCASHLALGRALKCNIDHDFNDYEEQGINFAKNHIDFMFGTKNLNVLAFDKEGKRYELIINGKWVI